MAQDKCLAQSCDWPAAIRGRCSAHHLQWKRGHPEGPIKRRVSVDRKCSVEGCSKGALRGPLCSMHAARRALLGDVGDATSMRPGGSRFINRDGYVRLHKPGHPNANCDGYVQEHRFVMEQELGRPLLRSESVHHRNGIRSDNRIENLEVWVTPQPAGQRPVDLVDWILDNYSDIVEQRQAERRAN